MTDPIDRCCEREDEFRADALAEQRRRAGLDGKTAADSSETCNACGEPIPEARRQAVPGVQTCIECQTLIERAGLRVFPERNA
jgi:phage/conjugal plasmid C-4 type zinc finger TraR family protein